MSDDFRIESATPVSADAVASLFAQTDWAQHRSVEDIAVMLDADSFHVTAWSGEQLIGFARVLSDSRFRAFIEDVIVDAAWRDRGVGSALVQRALDALLGVEEVVLGCTEDNVGYYERFGFRRVTHATLQLKTT